MSQKEKLLEYIRVNYGITNPEQIQEELNKAYVDIGFFVSPIM